MFCNLGKVFLRDKPKAVKATTTTTRREKKESSKVLNKNYQYLLYKMTVPLAATFMSLWGQIPCQLCYLIKYECQSGRYKQGGQQSMG